jgi:histidine triad (HIT) family protein
MNECIFCRIIAGEIPSRRVHEDAEIVGFEDVNPAAPVHVLVVPRAHLATLDDTDEAADPLLGRLMGVARNLARDRGLTEGGYRLVMNVGRGAGQSVFHIHLHLLGGRGFEWPPG